MEDIQSFIKFPCKVPQGIIHLTQPSLLNLILLSSCFLCSSTGAPHSLCSLSSVLPHQLSQHQLISLSSSFSVSPFFSLFQDNLSLFEGGSSCHTGQLWFLLSAHNLLSTVGIRLSSCHSSKAILALSSVYEWKANICYLSYIYHRP